MSVTSKCLRARWVLPIEGPVIENGEVIVDDGLIVDVRAAKGTAPGDALDLGDAILLPGLVNVHTHLDYTVMRGLLEDIAFFPWIRELTVRKGRADVGRLGRVGHYGRGGSGCGRRHDDWRLHGQRRGLSGRKNAWTARHHLSGSVRH